MEGLYEYKHNPIVRRIFLAMLAPTILMNLTTAIGSVADTMIIGHYLDDKSLSVVTFATPIYMVINTFAALFAVGGCIAMSIDSGKGDKKSANEAFGVSMLLLATTGLLLLLSGLFFSEIITGWLGAGKDVFEAVEEYSKIILVGGPVFVMNIGLAFFVRNDGRPTLSMIGMFSSIIVDITLNFVFVGYLGMGVSGAAYSTVIGQIISIVVIGTHFLSSKCTLRFRFVFNKTAWRIVKNGASSALHFVYQFVTILIINHFLSKLAGTDGVVIYTVVFNLSTVSLSVFEGISQTIQPMISNYYGEKSYVNIKETLRLAMLTIFIICGGVTVLLEVVPQVVPIVFGIDDALLIGKSAVAVRIFATSMIIMTINVVIGYYLQSTEQNLMSMIIISLRCFVLFLGATFILGKCFGMNGVWAAYTAAEVLTFLVIFGMVKVKQKRLKTKGVNADMLLLDKETRDGIACYTFNCGKDDFEEYKEYIANEIGKVLSPDNTLCKDVGVYLEEIAHCVEAVKERLVEVEINKREKKIIIRDNLKHTGFSENWQKRLSEESVKDYGPVLGWNRMCIG